jgi:hypothetical protein
MYSFLHKRKILFSFIIVGGLGVLDLSSKNFVWNIISNQPSKTSQKHPNRLSIFFLPFENTSPLSKNAMEAQYPLYNSR